MSWTFTFSYNSPLFTPSSWQVTWSRTSSPPLAQWRQPCCWSSFWWWWLLWLPPTRGRLREPTAPAVRKKKALEWKCGAWGHPLPWRGWFRSLLSAWDRDPHTVNMMTTPELFPTYLGSSLYNWAFTGTVRKIPLATLKTFWFNLTSSFYYISRSISEQCFCASNFSLIISKNILQGISVFWERH